MNWKIVLVALFAIALLLTPAALAEEDGEDTELEDPGVLPNHPFYAFKVFGEKFRMWFMFSNKAKIKYKLKLAGRRLAEAEGMSELNKTEIVQQLMEQYQAHIEAAQQIRERMRAAGTDEEIEEEVDAWMNRTTNKHIYVLQRVLEKAPEPAKPGLQNALQNAEQNREKIRERLIEKWKGKRTTTTTEATTTTTTEETTTTTTQETTTTTQAEGAGGPQEGIDIGDEVVVNHTSSETNETETNETGNGGQQQQGQ